MSILRVCKRNKTGFTQLDNALINNTKLSFRSLGVLTYLLSKPHNWRVRMAELSKPRTEGREAIRATMNELEAAGYMQRKRVQDKDTGQMKGWVYEVSEDPQLKDGFPSVGYPTDGSPTAGFSPPTKKEGTKTDLTKNKKKKTPVVPQGGQELSSLPGSARAEPTNYSSDLDAPPAPPDEHSSTPKSTIPEAGKFPRLGKGPDFVKALHLYDGPAAAQIIALFPGQIWTKKTARPWLTMRRDGEIRDKDVEVLSRFFREASDLTDMYPDWKPRHLKGLLHTFHDVLAVVRLYAANMDPEFHIYLS